MARSRRKQRQQEDAPVNGGVAEELREEADHPVPPTEPPAEGYPTEIDGEFEDDVSLRELIAALGPLRRTRRHPLLQGIRMFTAMLDEARGGYGYDRLDQLEEALGISFEPREREGILQIAMGAMDDAGVPDVEHGVQIALETRAELQAQMGHPDPDDEPEDAETAEEGEPSDPDAPGPDES